MISEYEEREAAIFSGTPWRDWETMEPKERAAIVAHMRYHSLIESHVTDIVHAESERRNRVKRSSA